MRIKIALVFCGVAALVGMAPVAASAQSVFSFSVGSGYNSGYSGYGYPTYGYAAPHGYDGYNRYSGYDRHERQHDHLDDEHGDVHDQLDEEHAQAHAQGLDPWEHAQLHRHLQREHDYAHDQLDRQHEYQHRLNEWRRQQAYYGYYGY